jgi:hypothetical protein
MNICSRGSCINTCYYDKKLEKYLTICNICAEKSRSYMKNYYYNKKIKLKGIDYREKIAQEALLMLMDKRCFCGQPVVVKNRKMLKKCEECQKEANSRIKKRRISLIEDRKCIRCAEELLPGEKYTACKPCRGK